MAGLGVGGAAASGLEAGFGMGLRADEAQERRKQREVDNIRMATLDAERTAERDRNNEIQDTGLRIQALDTQLAAKKGTLEAIQARYPGAVPPEAEVRPHIDESAKLYNQKLAIYDALLNKGKQEVRNFNALVAGDHASLEALPPVKLRENLRLSTGFGPEELTNGTLHAAVIAAQDGMQAQNWPQVMEAANVLLPEIRKGIGGVASDGSRIVKKRLVGFAPAPMGPPTEAGAQPAVVANPIQGLTAALNAATMPGAVPDNEPPGAPGAPGPGAPGAAPQGPQPGTDPDKVLPILEITTQQPDGSFTIYHAPITTDRHDPNSPIAGPVSVKDLMDRLGQVGVLDTWAQKPDVKAKLEASIRAGKPTTYEEAWGMVHGDTKMLARESKAAQEYREAQQIARDTGRTVEEVLKTMRGKVEPQATGVQGTLNAIKGSGLSPEQQAQATRVALKVEAAPKAGKVGPTGSSKALGGVEAPTGSEDKVVDFWARAVIGGDRNWQVGLARSKSGSSLIEKVKRRVPELAAEMGLDSQDIGAIYGQAAALDGTLKELTKRAEAVELFANKVDKDMKTFDAALNKAGMDSPLLINKPINALRRQFSDPELAQLDLAAKQVGAEYERLITGGTLSVAQLHVGAAEDAKKLINGDMPPKQARAIMETMRQEMKNARTASHEAQQRVVEQRRGLGRDLNGPPSGKGTGFGVAGIGESEGAPAKPAAVQTATNPKTGEKLQLVNGAWVPVK